MNKNSSNNSGPSVKATSEKKESSQPIGNNTPSLPKAESSPQFIEPLPGAVKTDNDVKSTHDTKILDNVKPDSAFKQMDINENSTIKKEYNMVGISSNCKVVDVITPTGAKECVDLSDGYSTPKNLNYMPTKTPDSLVYSWNDVKKLTRDNTRTVSINFNERTRQYLDLFSFVRFDLIFKLTCKIPFNSNKRYWISYNSDPNQAAQPLTDKDFSQLKGFEWAPSERNEIFVRIPYSAQSHFLPMEAIQLNAPGFGVLNITDISTIVGLGTYDPVLTVHACPQDMMLAVPSIGNIPQESDFCFDFIKDFPRPNHPWAQELMRNGFKYITSDITFCSRCKLTINDWEEGDLIPVEHKRHGGSRFCRSNFNSTPLKYEKKFDDWCKPVYQEQIDKTSVDMENKLANHELGSIDQTTTRDNIFTKVSQFTVSQDTTQVKLNLKGLEDNIIFSELNRFKHFSTHPKLKIKALNIPLNSVKFRVTQIPTNLPSTITNDILRNLPGIEWDIHSEELILQPFIQQVTAANDMTSLLDFTYNFEVINCNISADTDPIFDVFINTSSVQRHCLKQDSETPVTKVIYHEQINVDDKVVKDTSNSKTGLLPYDQGTTTVVADDWQYLTTQKLDPPIPDETNEYEHRVFIMKLTPATLGQKNAVSWSKYNYYRGEQKFKFQTKSTSAFVNSHLTYPIIIAHIDSPFDLPNNENFLDALKLYPHVITTDSAILHCKWRNKLPYLTTDATDFDNHNGYIVACCLGPNERPISLTVETDSSDITFNRPRPYVGTNSFPKLVTDFKQYNPTPISIKEETIKPKPEAIKINFKQFQDFNYNSSKDMVVLPKFSNDFIKTLQTDPSGEDIYNYNGLKLAVNKGDNDYYKLEIIARSSTDPPRYSSLLDNIGIVILRLPENFNYGYVLQFSDIDDINANGGSSYTEPDSLGIYQTLHKGSFITWDVPELDYKFNF